MAFFQRAQRKGKTRWRIVWEDATKGAGRAGRRWANCLNGKHQEAFDAAQLRPQERAALANGATNEKLRNKLLKCYKALEISKRDDAARAGGYGTGPRYDEALEPLLDEFKTNSKESAKVRDKKGGRAGKSKRTAESYGDTVNRFKQYLKVKGLTDITTGELEPEDLKSFKRYMERVETLAPPTINRHLRTLKVALNQIYDRGDQRPFFRTSREIMLKALKPVPVEQHLPGMFEPKQLAEFLSKALEMDKGKETRTKLSNWVLFLMLTGCRRGEAEQCRWEDVDLEKGTIIFRAEKTGKDRRLFLTDKHGLISPGLLEIMKLWREQKPSDKYVMPYQGKSSGIPMHPRQTWNLLREKSGVDIRTKDLRSNWVSYMASMGRPSAVVALMAGHSPTVLAKHYLSYAHARLEGDSLDETMGLSKLLKSIIERPMEEEGSSSHSEQSKAPKTEE